MAGMGPDGIGQIISVDGRAGPHVGLAQKFVFSADSAHFAYLDLEGGPKGTTTKIMLDHKPVQTFGPQLTMMVFAATRENQAQRQLPPRDSRSAPASAALTEWFAFRPDNKLKFLATRDGKIYRVTITPGAAVGSETLTTAAAPISEVAGGVPSARLGKSAAIVRKSRLVSQPSAQPTPETSTEIPTEDATQTVARASAAAASSTDTSDPSGIAGKIVQAFSDGDLEAFVSMYADTIDYLDSGRISSADVRSQLQ
jgi:hypothetical protein